MNYHLKICKNTIFEVKLFKYEQWTSWTQVVSSRLVWKRILRHISIRLKEQISKFISQIAHIPEHALKLFIFFNIFLFLNFISNWLLKILEASKYCFSTVDFYTTCMHQLYLTTKSMYYIKVRRLKYTTNAHSFSF